VFPVAKEKDYTSIPEGILPFRSVVRLSRQLKAGRSRAISATSSGIG